jgi:hypothetical protein
VGLKAGDVTNYSHNGEVKAFEIDEQVANICGFHPATDESRPLHEETRQHFIWLMSWVKAYVPVGREQSIAITKLQEALWATNAAIAINLAPLGDD